MNKLDVMGDPEEEQKVEAKPTKTVTAVLIGAVGILGALQTIDMATADAQADKIVRGVQRPV